MLDLYPHQRAAVDSLQSGKILYGGVGTGKSRTSVAYYMEKQLPRDVYVITTAMKRDSLDWEKEFLRVSMYKGERSVIHNATLFVDSWNNIAKYKNVRDAFFIFDEQRLVGSGAWAKAFEHIVKPQNNNTWILLSATPGDTWLDYMSVFIANGFYKNRTEFKDEHVVYSTYVKFPKVERYINEGKLHRLREQILVHMPYDRETMRITQRIGVEYDKALMAKITKERWNPYEGRPIKSLAEYFYLKRKVLYSDKSRVEKVREVLKKHQRLIIFYNFDYELEALRTLSDVTNVAEWNGHKHQEIPNANRWVYLVQYISGSEGWNCITTDATLFFSLTYSYRQWHQAHGRIDRLDTPFRTLFYYILMCEEDMDKAVMDALSEKHSFNESAHARKTKLLTA